MTRVSISKHPSSGFKVASIDVPVIVGDVPGSIRIRCAHPSATGALMACADMAQRVATDPAIGAIVPDGTCDDIDAVNSVALAARAGYGTLHAATLGMPPGHRKLARALASEAKTYGGDDDPEGIAVGGFFDSIENLAKSVANSVVNYADPDHWPAWMKNLAKPVGRAALDAAAVAVFGPAGPAAVETMIHIVDQAQAGDPKAQQQLQDIAEKALKGDAKAKVLMSAVHEADASKDAKADAKASKADNSKSIIVATKAKAAGMDWAGVGDAFDDYMAQYGAAYDPNTWSGADDAYEAAGSGSSYMDQQFQQAEQYGGYDDSYPQYGPVYMPQYAAQPYPQYGGYDQQPLPPPPQMSADGKFWWNQDHWERTPAGGMPQQAYDPSGGYGYGDPYGGYAQPGQPSGFDASGWPFDASGQPWPSDANGQPVDPSQAQQQSQQSTATTTASNWTAPAQGARVHAGTRANAAAIGPRGGGVTITQGPARGGGSFAGARDNRSGSKPAGVWGNNGGLFSALNHSSGGGGRDHRGH